MKATLKELMEEIHASKLKLQNLSTQHLEIEGRIQRHWEFIAKLETKHDSLKTKLSHISQGSPEELRWLTEENVRAAQEALKNSAVC